MLLIHKLSISDNFESDVLPISDSSTWFRASSDLWSVSQWQYQRTDPVTHTWAQSASCPQSSACNNWSASVIHLHQVVPYPQTCAICFWVHHLCHVAWTIFAVTPPKHSLLTLGHPQPHIFLMTQRRPFSTSSLCWIFPSLLFTIYFHINYSHPHTNNHWLFYHQPIWSGNFWKPIDSQTWTETRTTWRKHMLLQGEHEKFNANTISGSLSNLSGWSCVATAQTLPPFVAFLLSLKPSFQVMQSHGEAWVVLFIIRYKTRSWTAWNLCLIILPPSLSALICTPLNMTRQKYRKM